MNKTSDITVLMGLDKEAIQTGPLGYLTAGGFAPYRASEIKGVLKSRGEDMPSTIARPVLSYLKNALIGGGLGALGGAGLGGLAAGKGGAAGGALLGANTGVTLSALITTLMQQRQVGKSLGKLKETDPDLYAILRKNVPNTDKDIKED